MNLCIKILKLKKLYNGINIQTKIIPASVTYETLENTRLK